MRLAFLSPLPPARTGIADYSADVLALLEARHSIDVFHAQPEVDRGRMPRGCGLHPVGSFAARHQAQPYDLAIYQLGNGPDHDFLYPALARVPGLLVLHDLVLHHARARMFLEAPELLAYRREPASAERRAAARRPLAEFREELEYCHPGRGRRLLDAQLGTVGDLLPYAYPLFRLPVEASRLVGVHNGFMAAAVRAEVPEAVTRRIPMPMARAAVDRERVTSLRAQLGLAPDALVVASYGLLTREKGIETLARAVARVAGSVPQVRLLLVGPVPEPERFARMLEDRGVRSRTVVTGRIPFELLPAHIEAADVAVHLRYPTARETSAALLRVLAQGRATVMSDLEHLDEIPREAVVRVDASDEEGEITRALLRLAAHADLRRRLGEAAAAFVAREHAADRTRDAYAAAIEHAAARTDPPRRSWPSHWSALRE